MPSEFAALERLLSAEVDAHFGESTRLEPKSTGRYFGKAADSIRPPRTISGVVDFNPITLVAQDKGRYDGLRPAIAGEKAHVSYDEALFDGDLPQEGDEIFLLEPARRGERLRVSRADPDGLGRVVCVCARVTPGDDE